jgi:acyl-CoA dehydrogenase
MGLLIGLAIVALLLVALARVQAPLVVWSAVAVAGLTLAGLAGLLSAGGTVALWALLLAIAVPLNIAPLRRSLISNPLLARTRRVLPPMSQTEREAVDAGTVWWEAELFRGNPDWSRLLQARVPELTEAERSFIEGPVEELCAMLDDWQITHELNDLPPEVWEFMKRHRFFGMIIPKSYEGLGFSALAHSAVVMKLASRSVTGAVTVMVPNSLGPAELLLHYGTGAQKDYYLPRLARGEEIPCFALTGPWAGSDAGSIPDHGVVCKGWYQGREVLGFRVTWEKRYITLGPVATLLGLAFKAYDPDRLLGGDEDLGITCALIPANTPGVKIGRRHYPLDSAFQNGPNSGKDVFVPMERLIGGEANVGKGWRMLVESLSAGRGISLPALGAGSGKLAARITGAYARVRKQFRLPIGSFEGVQEALARIGGLAYLMDAARVFTAAAIDGGERPAVATAIVKYHLTEAMRQVVNDAMDVHGGRGICLGPANYLGRVYQTVPISITVEGANILTRSMIIFGQGAMRCHPYLVREIAAASDPDRRAGGREFDRALFGHMGYTVANAARAFVYGLSRARLAPSPVTGPTAKYYRRLARMSAAYAFLADLALLFLGGTLKRREMLSGRFADGLSFMYLCSASLRRFEDHGRPEADLPLLEWACKYCLYRVQGALDEILRNFPARILGQLLRLVVFPLGRRFRYPNDALAYRVASLLLEPSETRDRLTSGIYITEDPSQPTGRVEYALRKVLAAEPVERALRQRTATEPLYLDHDAWLADLVKQQVISQEEADRLREAREATRAAIDVDDFAPRRKARAATHRAA